jgi:hypothetical protein
MGKFWSKRRAQWWESDKNVWLLFALEMTFLSLAIVTMTTTHIET